MKIPETILELTHDNEVKCIFSKLLFSVQFENGRDDNNKSIFRILKMFYIFTNKIFLR